MRKVLAPAARSLDVARHLVWYLSYHVSGEARPGADQPRSQAAIPVRSLRPRPPGENAMRPRSSGARPGRSRRRTAAPPRVEARGPSRPTGHGGPLVSRSASSVRWPGSAPGISGDVGRMSGKARAPAFDSGVGKGRRRRPPPRARVVLAGPPDQNRDRQVGGPLDEVAEREPRVGHPLPAGEQAGVHDHEAVEALRRLHRDTQADRAAPVVHDTVASRRSSSSTRARTSSVWRSYEYHSMSGGLSERPKPARSGAMQRKPASRTGGITLRHRTTTWARRAGRARAGRRPRRGGRAAGRRSPVRDSKGKSSGSAEKRSSGVR